MNLSVLISLALSDLRYAIDAVVNYFDVYESGGGSCSSTKLTLLGQQTLPGVQVVGYRMVVSTTVD